MKKERQKFCLYAFFQSTWFFFKVCLFGPKLSGKKHTPPPPSALRQTFHQKFTWPNGGQIRQTVSCRHYGPARAGPLYEIRIWEVYAFLRDECVFCSLRNLSRVTEWYLLYIFSMLSIPQSLYDLLIDITSFHFSTHHFFCLYIYFRAVLNKSSTYILCKE